MEIKVFTENSSIPVTVMHLDGDFFGNERLLALLTPNPTPAELLNKIESGLNQFIGEADQFDDITLLAIKRKTN